MGHPFHEDPAGTKIKIGKDGWSDSSGTNRANRYYEQYSVYSTSKDSAVVAIDFKRMKSMKNTYQSGCIRPIKLVKVPAHPKDTEFHITKM